MRRKFNKIPKLHVKKGDMVKVLSGDYKNTVARVLEVDVKNAKAFVEGVNVVTKHLKAQQQNQPGDKIEKELPIRVCKLQLIEPKTGKPTRIGRKLTEKGWVRISKKTGNVI